jgi:hypothetical protein
MDRREALGILGALVPTTATLVAGCPAGEPPDIARRTMTGTLRSVLHRARGEGWHVVTLYLADGTTRQVLPAEEIRETLDGQVLWATLVAVGADGGTATIEGRDDGRTVWATKVIA